MGPLARFIFDPNTPAIRRFRNIENNYHIQLMARSAQETRNLHGAMLLQQMSAAAQQDRHLSEIGYSLNGISSALENLGLGIESIERGLGRLSDTADSILDGIWNLTDVVSTHLDEISAKLNEHTVLLTKISHDIHNPRAVEADELMRSATSLLAAGMRSGEPNRSANYDDAWELITELQANPIGRTSSQVWFQLGWLHWKYKSNYIEAEKSFGNAARYAEVAGSSNYIECLRHQGYMRYLLDDYEGAYTILQQAINVQKDSLTLVDAARYSSLTGRTEESISRVKAAIRDDRFAIVSVLAEVDFVPVKPELDSMIEYLVKEARDRVMQRISDWRHALEVIKDAVRAEYIPEGKRSDDATEVEKKVKTLDYITALKISDKIQEIPKSLLSLAQSNLQNAQNKIQKEIASRNYEKVVAESKVQALLQQLGAVKKEREYYSSAAYARSRADIKRRKSEDAAKSVTNNGCCEIIWEGFYGFIFPLLLFLTFAVTVMSFLNQNLFFIQFAFYCLGIPVGIIFFIKLLFSLSAEVSASMKQEVEDSNSEEKRNAKWHQVEQGIAKQLPQAQSELKECSRNLVIYEKAMKLLKDRETKVKLNQL